MSRKRTPQNPEPPADTTTAATEPPPAAGDNTPAATTDGPGFAARVGQKNAIPVADPFPIASDSVAGVRLLESRRDRQMAIKFEEKPGQAVIDMLKEAGFRWKPADKIWAHPVWPASAMSTRIKAERLYQEVCNAIRQVKGVETGQDIPF